MAQLLQEYLSLSARALPDNIAAIEAGEARISYAELEALSDRVRDRLRAWRIGSGDRVGICLRKSIDALAAIFGILKAGAAYVPVDPDAPMARNADILNDCRVSAAFMEARFSNTLGCQLQGILPPPRLLTLEAAGGGVYLRGALDRLDQEAFAEPSATAATDQDALAYILYTSGSTGRPKGVMLSHRNATSFIDWCSKAFEPTSADRFASHAPFHFDLSILDVFLSCKHGAALVLIAEETGKDPIGLAPLIAQERISIWYSAPSILSLLAQFGRMEDVDYSALRLVLFAGEIFPVKHLRTLTKLVPAARYFNLYGPTETNVCTFHEIPIPVPEDRTTPYPIGRACPFLQTMVADPEGLPLIAGKEGELCVSGPAVMMGYWNLPEQTERVLSADPSGALWYRTGDIVVEQTDGSYQYVGRRDRMVKKRGYRVELGEIEAALYRHPNVKEAGVVAFGDDDNGVRIKAYLSCSGGERPSIIEMKRFCAEHLPMYMVPDLFSFKTTLPRTSTAKIDYQLLKESD